MTIDIVNSFKDTVGFLAESILPGISPAIRERKDLLNLRNTLTFVEENSDAYAFKTHRFLSYNLRACPDVKLPEIGRAPETSQIDHNTIETIFLALPKHLRNASRLESVDFTYADKVFSPEFDLMGNLNGVRSISISEFERKLFNRERVLVGLTSEEGRVIYPSSIPPSVSSNPEAIRAYQIHTMLHEFFHSIEIPLRTNESASQFMLPSGRNFLEWLRDYRDSLAVEPKLSSDYAESYRKEIFSAPLSSINIHGNGFREEIAEAFAGYFLDIVPNQEGYRSFQHTVFSDDKLPRGSSHSLRFELLDELAGYSSPHR